MDPIFVIVTGRATAPRGVVAAKEPGKQSARGEEKKGAPQPDVVPLCGFTRVLQICRHDHRQVLPFDSLILRRLFITV